MENWDATETAQRIAAGDVSAVEVMEAAIKRTEAWNPKLNALTHFNPERALADARHPRPGIFAGVPTFVKDLEDLAGVPTGCGTAAFNPGPAKRNAATVEQFLDTGLISLGKTTTSEFGLTASVEPVGGTPTLNPINLAHTAGGSSGGAGAVVAAGVVPIAHGGDGGGSIRIPAAFCGLVGLKPSRGRLAMMDKAQHMAVRIAQMGILTASVRDTANYYAAVEQAAPAKGLEPVGRIENAGSEKFRIGAFIDTPLSTEVDPEVRQATEATAARLEALGHEIRWIKAPADQDIADDFLLYWAFNAFLVKMLLTTAPKARARKLEPWTKGLASEARRNIFKINGAIKRLRAYEATYAAVFEDIDVLMCPTTTGTAPRVGDLSPDQPFEAKREKLLKLLPYTPLQNISGAPAISVPMGKAATGLPMGVQLAGPTGGEARLLRLAFALEESA